MRVFSEYGTEGKLRALFKLPKGSEALKEELRFEVRATGDNVKEEAKAEVTIRYDGEKMDYLIKYGGEKMQLSELLKDVTLKWT